MLKLGSFSTTATAGSAAGRWRSSSRSIGRGGYDRSRSGPRRRTGCSRSWRRRSARPPGIWCRRTVRVGPRGPPRRRSWGCCRAAGSRRSYSSARRGWPSARTGGWQTIAPRSAAW